ncbi:kinase-like domain-containing protein [Aspergillus crustosus]
MGATNFPPGIGIQDIKGCGTSGMVALDLNTKYIIKFPLGDEDECARCNHEKEIYQLLESSSHERPPSLLKFHGSTSHGILLDYAELGPVRHFLRGGSHDPIPSSILLRWARQAAEALQFLHNNSICHGDVNCSNLFLDQHLDLKVGDFTSSLVGSLATPHDFQGDISNLGSAMYEMARGHLSYPTLSEDEREQKLEQREFPDLANVELKSMILRCWNTEYTCFVDIVEDIETTYTHLIPQKS